MRRLLRLGLIVWLFSGCGGAPSSGAAASGDQVAPASETRMQPPAAVSAREQGYDLQADEAFGGHTLARHVGRSDEELAGRLRRERDISAASTYPDRQTAQRAVARAIEGNRGRIDAWIRRSGRRPNLVLHFADKGGPPLGRILARGAHESRPCDGVLVVLRWDEHAGRWFVLTSYPEIAR